MCWGRIGVTGGRWMLDEYAAFVARLRTDLADFLAVAAAGRGVFGAEWCCLP